jgi:hypothetical protein
MTTSEADKWNKHFHTHVRPLDRNGIAMKPLDLVIIDDIPEWYCTDRETAGLKDYAGQYGLITYFVDEPWYGGLRGYPGWVSPNGESLHVVSRRICDDWVSEFDFSLPPSSVRKIPYNVIISAIFADYPCQMTDDDGPGTHPFIIRGMEQFAFIERVLKTPYEELEKAHSAAIRFLVPEA